MSVKGVHSPGGCGRREFRDRPIQAAAAGSPGNARTGRCELHPAWAATPASQEHRGRLAAKATYAIHKHFTRIAPRVTIS
ncbi:hypothetical protein GCM10027278_23800 [Paralcaligenes ginsengisoli]